MTPDRAQAWLHEVEGLMEHRSQMTNIQAEELTANYEAALNFRELALFRANQIKVKEGRIIGPMERFCY